MTRSRVWILTLLAIPLVAGPALAFSWPALFGLPVVFGHEAPMAQSTAPPMPYADTAPTRCPTATCRDEIQCELLCDCLATWRKLWEQGRFREAYRLAQCAAQAAPNSVDAQHALAVSQVVMNPQFMPINPDLRFFAQYAPVSGEVIRLDGNQVWSGFTPAGTLTPDLNVAPKCLTFDIECKIGDCPLTTLFSTIFGCCKDAKASCCDKCVASGCCSKSGCCAKCCKTESATSAVVVSVPNIDLVERLITRKLETPVSFHWKDTSLQQIIEDIKTLTNLNVVADTHALHEAGVCLSMPMSLSVDNVKLKSALNLVLTQAKLDYVIKDQVVQITTAEKANRYCEPTDRQADCCAVRMPAQNGPSMIWIIRESAPTMAPIVGGPTPPMLPAGPFVGRDEYAPALPAYFAPPPPPFVSPPDYLQFVPMPVPQLAPPPRPAPVSYVWANGSPQVVPVPPPAPEHLSGLAGDEGGKVPAQWVALPAPMRLPATQSPYVRAVQFEQAEVCEAIPPPTCVATSTDVRITQDGNRVRFTSPKYSAQCDRIRGGAKGQLILEGNVQLVSRRHGQTMTINAQRVTLNMADDQFVVEQAEGMETSRVNVAPVGGVIACEPAQEMTEQQREEARRMWLIERMLQQSRPDLALPFRNNNP